LGCAEADAGTVSFSASAGDNHMTICANKSRNAQIKALLLRVFFVPMGAAPPVHGQYARTEGESPNVNFPAFPAFLKESGAKNFKL
jgi:hypothetical protein